jgi:ubiquinone/menaquinone biosynthesis C-methylase UbiE
MSECIKTELSASTRGRTLDYAASVYDWLSPLMTFGHEKKMGQIALKLMDLKGHEKMIDIGCGTGTLTVEAGQKLSANKGGHIIGIDAAAKMIALARKKITAMPQVRFDVSAAEKLGYKDESFDLALSTFFFHHIDAELKLAALNEMWRVLKKGGKAVIVDVDTPTTLFGKICAWSGYILFHQEEIRENIEGKLREVMHQSQFGDFQFISSHLGYVSIFVLQKGL